MNDVKDKSGAGVPCEVARSVTFILQYLQRRSNGIDAANVVNEADAIDALLAQARAARTRYHKLVRDWLPSVRYAAATGALDKHHTAMHQRYGQRGAVPLAELIDEALHNEEVKKAIRDSSVSKASVEWLRGLIKASAATLHVTRDGVKSTGVGYERSIVRDSVQPLVPGSERLMSMLARTWDRHGRGLISLQPLAPSDQPRCATFTFLDSMALVVAAGAAYFDTDVRDFEDLRALPAVQGADGGVTAVISAVVAIATIVLWTIAEKSTDPGVQAFFFWLSTVLSGGLAPLVSWIGHGAPTAGCIVLPTGERACFAI